MKSIKVILGLSALLLTFTSSTLWASAHCVKGRSKVVVNENYAMAVTGLASKGIASGEYNCAVLSVLPGMLATQREIQCSSQKRPGLSILGWMIEGYDGLGHQAASVSLYSNGEKVFEAGCSRD